MYKEALKKLVSHKILSPVYFDRANVIFGFLNPTKGDIILDVGCGQGEFSHISAYFGAKSIGFDISKDLVKKAKQKALKGNFFLVADARFIPFKENSFNKVICNDILEHINEDEKVLTEVNEALKKQGRLVVGVPNYQYPFPYDPINRILQLLNKKPLKIGMYGWGHVRLYKFNQIKDILENQGFKIKNIGKTSFFLVCLCLGYLPWILDHFVSKKPKEPKKENSFVKKTLLNIGDVLIRADKKLFGDSQPQTFIFDVVKS